MSAAAMHLTPVVLELGGKCPVIVDSGVNLQVISSTFPSATWNDGLLAPTALAFHLRATTFFLYFLKVTARRIIMGKWGCNNGQACVSPDYIITTKDYAPKLVGLLLYIRVQNLFL